MTSIVDAGPGPDRIETAGALRAARRPAVPTAAMARTPASWGVVDHPCDRVCGPALSFRRDVTALGETFAEAGDLGPVGQRS
jgi:hypothetical protein